MYHFIIAIFALFVSAGVTAQEILVVTDQFHPVDSVPQNTRIIELDATDHLHNLLSANLPTDTKQATEIAQSRLNHDLHQQLATAYQGIVDAWTLGVQKIPAVIVDRKYVIYGEPNVSHALSRMNAYRRVQP